MEGFQHLESKKYNKIDFEVFFHLSRPVRSWCMMFLRTIGPSQRLQTS